VKTESHIVKELVFKLNKREKKWLEVLVYQHDTVRLNSLLGKNGDNGATNQ